MIARDPKSEKRAVGSARSPPSYAAGGLRPTSVYGVYSDRDEVEKTIERLRKDGFASTDISVVFPDCDMNKEFALEKNTKAPEGAMTGGGTGLLVGGALGGWLASGRSRFRVSARCWPLGVAALRRGGSGKRDWRYCRRTDRYGIADN